MIRTTTLLTAALGLTMTSGYKLKVLGVIATLMILLKNPLFSNIVKDRIPVTKKDALKCP